MRLLVVVAVATGAFAGAGARGLEAASQELIRYNDNQNCVWVKAEITTANSGTNAARVRVRQGWYGSSGQFYSCSSSFATSNAPGSGNLQLYFRNMIGSSVCTYGGWFSGGSSSSLSVSFTGARKCGGPSYYQTVAWGNVWNGAWLGTGQISGGNPVSSGFEAL